jgi:uncharacterized membrane protein required for colicin V production
VNDIVHQYIPFMNMADASVLVLVLAGAILGWRRGLGGEIARLAEVVAGAVAAFAGFRPLGAWLETHTRLQGENAETVAFIGLAIAVLALALALRLILGSLMQVVFAESINKRLALVVGMLRAAAFACLVFICMNLVPHDGLNRTFGDESLVGRQLRKAVPLLRERWGGGEVLPPPAEGVEIRDVQAPPE